MNTKLPKAWQDRPINRNYLTIKDVEEMISVNRKVVGAEVVGKYVALLLDNGMVIKILNF